MKKNRFISLLVVLVLIFIPFSINCIAENINGTELYTITASTDSNYCYYGSTVVEKLSVSEAVSKGIPDGYTGDIHSVLGSGSKGALVDFSGAKIPTEIVKSMTFRVYVGDDQRPADAYPEIRISWPNKTTAWIMRYSVSSKTDCWVDITLDVNGQNFYGNVGFDDISKGGYLDKFGLAIRTYASIEQAFYIDDISIEYKENDYNPPVITYTGEGVICVPEDSDIPTNATAYDSYEKRNVEVYWVWPDGTKLTDNGTPVKGTYNAKLCAKDFYGNISEQAVTVKIIEKDVTPPEINLKVEKIYAVVGTIPRLSVKVTDNNEIKSEEYIWSEKALDKRGRLTEGTHFWTIKAEDSSGNKSTKTVVVYVTKNETLNTTVIDEEALSRGGDIDGNGVLNQADITTMTDILATNSYVPEADLNSDGVLNILDLIRLKKMVMSATPKVQGDFDGDGKWDASDLKVMQDVLARGEYQEAADMNGDGTVNILDLVRLLHLISENAQREAADLDGDGSLTAADVAGMQQILMTGGEADINGDGTTDIRDLIHMKKLMANSVS